MTIGADRRSLLDTTLRAFSRDLSGPGEPGGGSAAAYVAALGTGLGAMVGELTLGKKKYAAVQDEVQNLIKQSSELRLKLEDATDADVRAFEPLKEAYALPRASAAEAAERDARIQAGLVTASLVPLDICRLTYEAVLLLERFAAIGSLIALSDAGVGAAFCQAALRAAQLNVVCNTRSLRDETRRAELEDEAAGLLEDGSRRCEQILELVYSRLGVNQA